MGKILINEYDCYSILKNEFLKKGYGFKRIESECFPDIIVFRNDDYYFIEVKFYRGKVLLSALTIDHLNLNGYFRPGQLLFRESMRIRNALHHYKLIVFNNKGERVEL